MRPLILPLVLLAAAACSRSHAPATGASAKPAGPDDSIAQMVPAGGAPAPAASVATPAPVAVDATGKTEPEAAVAADKADPRWQDVDPNTLGGRDESEMAKFLAEQRRRDAELMARDAAEAKSRVGDGREDGRAVDDDARGDESDRYAGEDRYGDARDDGRDDERGYDPRDDARDYEQGPYGGMPSEDAPYDEGEYDELPPDDGDYPAEDDDYDPRYDPGYDPRYDRR